MKFVSRLTLAAILFAPIAGCGGSNALAPQNQPEVVNTPNAKFSFQATLLQDVSDVLSYSWSVSSGHIIIHPATSITGGSLSLTIKDAAGSMIYDGPIPPSGDITPPGGTAGLWHIRVTFTNYTGTINFRLQMQ
ncbi:MAG TPA: hypothetical protein VLB12_18085 [Gemmatimonadales bacterium]|nr:hypothetical protein [Gemmatimonadales bacterium]